MNEMISHPQPYKQTRHTQTGKQQDTYRDTEGTGRGNLECYRTFHVKTDIVEDRKSAIEQKLIRKTYDQEIKKRKIIREKGRTNNSKRLTHIRICLFVLILRIGIDRGKVTTAGHGFHFIHPGLGLDIAA